VEGFQRPDLSSQYAAPRSDAEKALCKIWSELLGVRDVGVADSFFDLGGNSLVAVRLFAAMKRQFGVSLPLATLFQAPTIAELASLIGDQEEAKPAQQWTPLVCMSRGDASKRPFFLIHGSKGNILWFKALADLLRNTCPIYAFQAQGIDGSLPFLESIEEMAELYVNHAMNVDPDGPYRLLGYSGGGIIAIEMAQAFERRGRRVELILMLDSLTPDELNRPMRFVDKLAVFSRLSPGYLAANTRQKVQAFLQRKRKGAEVKSQIELLSDLSEAAYLRAQRKYRSQTYRGDIVLFRARDAAAVAVRAGPYLGWDKITDGEISVVAVNSDHAGLLGGDAKHAVVDEVKRRLAECDQARRLLRSAL
jgi:thioesterase domain-containing protein/acyl carrier protein